MVGLSPVGRHTPYGLERLGLGRCSHNAASEGQTRPAGNRVHLRVERSARQSRDCVTSSDSQPLAAALGYTHRSRLTPPFQGCGNVRAVELVG